jgi:hypothetical protein
VTSAMYEFTVIRPDDREVNGRISCHVDFDSPDLARVLLAEILADAARRDGARREDVWKYRMQVREQGKQPVMLTYVVPMSQTLGLTW